MIARVFQASESEEIALQRIGMAAVLRWAELPAKCQQSIVQQALAVSDSDAHIHAAIENLIAASSDRGRGG